MVSLEPRPPLTLLPELDTPALLVDGDRLDANLRRMADHVERAGLGLRPHAKTHKSVAIASRQLELGATGITVAKPQEALTLWQSGVAPIFLAYPPVGPHKLETLRPLIAAGSLTVGLDDAAVARPLGQLAAGLGATVPVLFEVDVGMQRTGLVWGAAAARGALEVAALPGITLAGIFAHEGHGHGVDRAELPNFAAGVAERMRATAMLIRAGGLECEVVSAGTVLTSWYLHRDQGVTEVRPGTYVFNDVRTVVDGGAEWDQCALRVLATVVSRPDATRLVIDAGSKTLTSAFDPKYHHGLVVNVPGADLRRLSEEHGIVSLSDPTVDVRVGDRVTIVPIHVCVTVNMQRELNLVRDGQLAGTMAVDAALCSR